MKERKLCEEFHLAKFFLARIKFVGMSEALSDVLDACEEDYNNFFEAWEAT